MGLHLVPEPADELPHLPAEVLAQSVMDNQFFCHVRFSVVRIGLAMVLRLTSPIRPGLSPGGVNPLLSFQRQPVTSHFSDCTLVDCRESFQGSAAEAAGPVAGVMSHRRLGALTVVLVLKMNVTIGTLRVKSKSNNSYIMCVQSCFWMRLGLLVAEMCGADN